MMAASNHLLDMLPAATRDGLMANLSVVPLVAGDALYQEYFLQEYVYFPTAGIVSFLHVMGNGDTAEVGLVGNDGLVGLAPVLGGVAASGRAVVQADGSALRMRATTLRSRVAGDPVLAATLAQYAQAFFAQVAQTAVCNMHHGVKQRLSRWILLMIDRLDADTFRMTQGTMADMLGTRREAISAIAGSLKQAGAIHYARGVVTVVDRGILEHLVCECYAVLLRDTDRLMRIVPAGTPL